MFIRSGGFWVRNNMGKRHYYTKKEKELIISRYPYESSAKIAKDLGVSVSSIYNQAHVLKLKKSEAYLKTPESGLFLKGERRGKRNQFKKGSPAFNKGLKQTEYMSKESILNSKKTRFKKGQLPYNTKYNGFITKRKAKSGRVYQFIRVGASDWVHLHVYNYIKANGPQPAGSCIIFKDGDTLNTSIENLECISRSENMKRNTIHNYPQELKEIMRLNGKLNRKINEKLTK